MRNKLTLLCSGKAGKNASRCWKVRRRLYSATTSEEIRKRSQHKRRHRSATVRVEIPCRQEKGGEPFWLCALLSWQVRLLTGGSRGYGLRRRFFRGTRRHGELQSHAELRQLHLADVAALRRAFQDKPTHVRGLGVPGERNQHQKARGHSAHLAEE